MHHKKSHSHPPRPLSKAPAEQEEPRAPARAPRRAADGHPRHHRREHRAAEPREGPAAQRLADQLDDHELLARLRQPPALRRPRRRPARAPPPVPDRPRRLHRRLRSPRPLAGTAAALFAARAGQGLGAAMLSPAALSIITTCFHGHAKAKALAAWGAVGGAGAAIGVLAGGLLTEFADWRMIFFVNLPVAVALAITALKVIPADTAKPRWRGLDLRGAILATTSLGAIVYAITQGSSAGWTSTQTLGFALAGLVGLAAFAVLETRTEKPLLKVGRLARSRRRRRALPDARGRRLDLRPLLPLLGLPPERPRHEPAA